MNSEKKIPESPVLTYEDDVDDFLREGENTSGNSAASTDVTNAQRDALVGVILNLKDTMKSVSDALAKTTPVAQLGGSTSADPANGPTQPPMKRLNLAVAPSSCTDEITDDAENQVAVQTISYLKSKEISPKRTRKALT